MARGPDILDGLEKNLLKRGKIMNTNEFKKKISYDHEVEEKIFRAGSQLYCSCVAYDVVSSAVTKEDLGATEEFFDFINEVIKACEGKNFIARDKALHRLTRH